MAVCSLSTATLNHSHSSSLLNCAASLKYSAATFFSRRIKSRTCHCKTRIASSHFSPKILNSNSRSKYGRPLSMYDSDDDSEDDEDEECSSDENKFFFDDFGDVSLSKADRQRLKLKGADNKGQGKGWNLPSSSPAHHRESMLSKYPAKIRRQTSSYKKLNSKDKEEGSSGKSRFSHLSEELGLHERYFPLLEYLSNFGLKESHFIQMYERCMTALQTNVESAQGRLNLLLSVGVKHSSIAKILVRQPQILGYTESNLTSHIAFLRSIGIPESRLGQVITAAPSLLSYSVENSLKPTIKYLRDEIGIQEKDICKVVGLSPQILVQRIDYSWNSRLNFMFEELDAPRKSVVKMVTKHPQLLHYSIEDGLRPRINFLRSIGMQNSDVLKVLTSLTQVFSLSLEGNLKPKYMYLIHELKNKVHSLTKYPTYLSLSLDQRIRPRHRFLVSLKKAPKGPFPLRSLVPNDECFCRQWAGTSIDEYLDFRQRLLLKDLAKK